MMMMMMMTMVVCGVGGGNGYQSILNHDFDTRRYLNIRASHFTLFASPIPSPPADNRIQQNFREVRAVVYIFLCSLFRTF